MGSFTKYILFLFAYTPIYLIVAIKKFNPNIFTCFGKFYPFKEILLLNWFSVALILFSIFLCLYFKLHEWYSLKTKGNPIFTIKNIDYQHKEYIVYLGTYILPFISLEANTVFDALALVFMFLTIGIIYSKTNLIYTNPTLMFFDYEIFEVTTDQDSKFICISKNAFQPGDKPIGKSIGHKTYIISNWQKEN